eukprot:scaffold582582_cov22-Prasinocladus_malaysianus.AAC.1
MLMCELSIYSHRTRTDMIYGLLSFASLIRPYGSDYYMTRTGLNKGTVVRTRVTTYSSNTR